MRHLAGSPYSKMHVNDLMYAFHVEPERIDLSCKLLGYCGIEICFDA